MPYLSQNLYDAMDPDKDTLTTRQLGRKELLDTEHQLLLLVERLLDKANYFQVRGLLSASYAMYGLLQQEERDYDNSGGPLIPYYLVYTRRDTLMPFHLPLSNVYTKHISLSVTIPKRFLPLLAPSLRYQRTS
jgi:hypothetical protein